MSYLVGASLFYLYHSLCETIQNWNEMLLCLYQLWEGRNHKFTWIAASGGELWSWERDGSEKATLWSHWWVVLGTVSQWPQHICVGDQKPRLVWAEIMSCFCDTSCSTWGFLSFCIFQWQNLLYSGNSQSVLWTSAPVCSALSWTECSVFAVSRHIVQSSG